ncbi:unnamed protein product [Ilex paraguariensis]|uniref:MULE transposase domain-containing protein n=1 Tax=Ilex paraguariensis TaxID=185542 RepID=A0ABC8SIG7_9AQUA
MEMKSFKVIQEVFVAMETNAPDSDGRRPFKRIFNAFHALTIGFIHGCRPFIGLDGCHLKGLYGGVLLVDVALNGNNGLFPVAYGVAKNERTDNWTFFLGHLAEIIGHETHPLYFMSDQ